jgi:uncharacterized protein YbbK (DUF523 family)
MDKILVSACLLGAPVRYNAVAKTLVHETLDRWRAEGRLVAICPEMAGGLPTPRPPAEVVGHHADGRAKVVDDRGRDVTLEFEAGAEAALALARAHRCRFALLKEGSPSCGSLLIYDGTFSGRKVPGTGVTAARLRAEGIQTFGEDELEALIAAVG